MSSYILCYNGACPKCRRLAAIVARAAPSGFGLADLNSSAAQLLLDRARPQGWRYAPYLVRLKGERVWAATGWRGVLALALLLGPRGSWQVVRSASQARLALLPRARPHHSR